MFDRNIVGVHAATRFLQILSHAHKF